MLACYRIETFPETAEAKRRPTPPTLFASQYKGRRYTVHDPLTSHS